MHSRVRPQSLWQRYWNRRARRLWRTTATDGLRGALDAPRAGQRFVHGCQVSGWVDGADAITVAAYLDGRRVWEGTADQLRADVSATARGFTTFVHAAPVATRTIPWLKVTARRAGGAEREALVLHEVPLVKGAASSRLPRWAYGQVWDREASTIEDAMDAVAGYTDRGEWERSGRATADHIAQVLGITPDDTVLEVGCGAGRVGLHMSRRCRHWIGADVSTRMLGFAREALREVDNVSFLPLNGFNLAGIADGSVQVVYCSAVFMHLDEWDRYRYVQEFFRVLAPGGRVYFDNFDLRSEDGWQVFEQMAALDPAVRPANVSRASTEQELTQYAARAGFGDVRSEMGRLWITVTARRP